MIMCLSIVFPPQNLNIKLLHQTKTSRNVLYTQYRMKSMGGTALAPTTCDKRVLYTQYRMKSMGGTALAPTTCDKRHNNSNLYQRTSRGIKWEKTTLVVTCQHCPTATTKEDNPSFTSLCLSTSPNSSEVPMEMICTIQTTPPNPPPPQSTPNTMEWFHSMC
jgi:hypothetical protein